MRKAPIIIEKDSMIFVEDSKINLLTALPTIISGWKDDLIFIKNVKTPKGMKLVRGVDGKKVSDIDEDIEISNDDLWYLETEENLSGSFTLEYSVVAKPNSGNGKEFKYDGLEQTIIVEGVADKPILKIIREDGDIKENGWLSLATFIDLPIKSVDTDNSETIYLEFSTGENNGDGTLLFNKNISAVGNNKWRVLESEIDTLEIYFGELQEDQIIHIAAISEEGLSKNKSEERSIRIKANAKLRAPILESKGSITIEEDTLMPVMSDDGGSISVTTQGETKGQVIELEISNIPEGFKIVKADFETNEILSQPIMTGGDEDKYKIRLPIEKMKNIAIKAPDNYYGDIEIEIQAIASNNTGNEKVSTKQSIKYNIQPINDDPSINENLLNYSVIEGEMFNLSLVDLISDVDNVVEELSVDLYPLDESRMKDILPEWLELTEDKRIVGSPGNNDVGKVNIGVLVNDILGSENRKIITIDVGNKNEKPNVNHQSSQLIGWDRDKRWRNNILKNILIKEEL